MKLLLDIGNTRTKWALHDGLVIVDRGAQLNSEIDSLLLPSSELSLAMASSVAAEPLAQALSSLIVKQTGCELAFAQVSRSAGGLDNGYRTLDKLGVDRWVAAIGAWARYPDYDLVVIDAGTAVTVDWVSKQGVYEGGVILPGLTLMHDALVGSTAGIDSRVLEVQSVIGKSTEECVNSGAFFGLVGAIDRITEELISARTNSDDPVKVLLCGGDAQSLSARLTSNSQLEPDLIFDGLNVLSTDAVAS